MISSSSGLWLQVASLRVILYLAAISAYEPRAKADLWCTGYYPGWEQSAMPPSAIDYSALTHIIHFSAEAKTNKKLNTSANSLTVANSSSIVSATHTAGKKVLVCIGVAGTQAGFQGATSSNNVVAFINNI